MRIITTNRLEREGIPVNRKLPEIRIKTNRTSKEVAIRLNILGIFLAISDDSSSIVFFRKLLQEQEMYKFLTDTEKRILENGHLTKQEEIDLSWNQESMYALSWCLGIVSEMAEPIFEADLDNIFKFLPPEVDLDVFLEKSKLVNAQIILQELDYYYNLHWAIRHPESWSFMKIKKMKKYKMSIVRERRKGLEWVHNSELIWDDISLDT